MVSRSWQVATILTLAILATACDAMLYSGGEKSSHNEKRNITVELHNGDIAFRRGSGAASHMVLAADNQGSYSHVGIVVCVDSVWRVIHAVPFEGQSAKDDHIYGDEVGEFFGKFKAVAGAIYRYQALDSAQITAITNYAKLHLDRTTPFDHDYNLDDDSRQYCSELVWRCFLQANIDITNGERSTVTLPTMSGKYILPSDIELNKKLTCVYTF